MSIGIRAALVIANHREYKQQAPPPPGPAELTTTSTEMRNKNLLSSQFLTDAAAKEAGLTPYLKPLRGTRSSYSSPTCRWSIVNMMVKRTEVQALYKRDDRKGVLTSAQCFDALPRLLTWLTLTAATRVLGLRSSGSRGAQAGFQCATMPAAQPSRAPWGYCPAIHCVCMTNIP